MEGVRRSVTSFTILLVVALEMMVGFFSLKFDATMPSKELTAPEGAIHVH